MKGISKFFDINMVLMAVFSSLESSGKFKGIELVYDIEATVPKELKGDPEALTRLLTHIMTFVFKNTEEKEVVLYISAPKDFLYEEPVSFKVKTGLDKQKVANFLKIGLVNNLELVGGNIVVEEENPSDIRVDIPIRLNELGVRRYYRLPDMAMLGKKVLLLCTSPNVAVSIKKMFKYFLYEVDAGTAEFKKSGSDLSQYDILVVENRLVSEKLQTLVEKIQKQTNLKYVILEDADYTETKEKKNQSAHLVKPVMQESIYELIIRLYEEEIQDRSIKPRSAKIIVNMENYINGVVSVEDRKKLYSCSAAEIKKNESKKDTGPVLNPLEYNNIQGTPILNINTGEENSRKYGVNYKEELTGFKEAFDKSDVYFKQMVSEKSTWKIKEFCIDLEKRAKFIGAQSMLKLAEEMSLLFVYDKFEKLPTFPARYHGEMKKLFMAIDNYLSHDL